MLLVILGAGASHDSVPPEALPAFPQWDYQPPLADKLLDNRPPFGEILDRFPQCLPLVNPLRRKAASTGFALEKELESLLREADEYPPRRRQFAAFRFYLQQVLWQCGKRWGDTAHGSTNYVELLTRLDVWRERRRQRVLVVTFNYDLLLERAATDSLARAFDTPAAYVSKEEWKFSKVHGSVNWGRFLTTEPGPHVDDPHAWMINEVERLRISDEIVVSDPALYYASNETPLFPAISVPVVSKSESSFECPREHMRILQDLLPEVRRVLIIGWRGMESHFLGIVRKHASQIESVFAVTADESEAKALARNFPKHMAAGAAWDGTGFSGFLRHEHLEGWLG